MTFNYKVKKDYIMQLQKKKKDESLIYSFK